MSSTLFRVLIFTLVTGMILVSTRQLRPRAPMCSKRQNLICNHEYVPVCGTDGNTYGSECQLCWMNRHRSTKVFIKKMGHCQL